MAINVQFHKENKKGYDKMPRYNIEHNGKWACFSAISDGFITEFMDKDTYEKWRKLEYGLKNYEPAENCNMATIDYAVHSIRLNRNREEAMKCLLECGLPTEECEKLMDDMERKYYYPRLQVDGTYLCPNCKAVVVKGQERCKEEFCEIELIWKE